MTHAGISPVNCTLPRAFVLQDHARLPGRFFGRMTSAVLAGL
jgi:hypothetical protein